MCKNALGCIQSDFPVLVLDLLHLETEELKLLWLLQQLAQIFCRGKDRCFTFDDVQFCWNPSPHRPRLFPPRFTSGT